MSAGSAIGRLVDDLAAGIVGAALVLGNGLPERNLDEAYRMLDAFASVPTCAVAAHR